MDKFIYRGKAEICHLNIRKEGPEDNKALTLDIKFRCVADMCVLDLFHEGLSHPLFTDIGAAKNKQLKPIAFSNTLHGYTMETLGQFHSSVELSKFAFEPKDGSLVTLIFSASLAPTSNEVAQLAEFVTEEIDLLLQPQPTLEFGSSDQAGVAGRTP